MNISASVYYIYIIIYLLFVKCGVFWIHAILKHQQPRDKLLFYVYILSNR